MPRRLLLLIAVLIPVLAVVVFAIFSLSSGSSSEEGERWEEVSVPQGQLQPGQPFQFRRFAYRHTSYTLEEVQLRVANTSDAPQRGVVWYLLAPPNATEAWREAVWSSAEQEISLLPDESADLTFAPPDDIPPGSYAISAWVHGLRAGERFHADGAGSLTPLFIGPPFDLVITNVTRAEQIDGSTALDVTLAADNNSGAGMDVSLAFSVIESQDGRATTTEAVPLYTSPAYTTSLNNGETAAATLHGTVSLPSGNYAIVGLLRNQQDQSVVISVVASEILAIE
ncbi:MAG: hypothetical protein IPK19_08315 [Chloroflexi bacterium]|nr:hypothetical protein [Chloroflexota bacterium]